MTQTIYGMISDNGDGSSSMWWFRELPDEEAMTEKNPETWGMSEGIAETLTFPAELNLEKCGFSFSTLAEAIG